MLVVKETEIAYAKLCEKYFTTKDTKSDRHAEMNTSRVETNASRLEIHLHLPLYKHALSTRLMCSGRSAFLQDVIVQCSMYIPQS